MTALLIDLAVIGTVAFCTWRGYKNGLIRGVFGIVSLIAALLVANIAAQAYSNDAKAMLMPFASGLIDTTLAEMKENDIEYQPVAHDHDNDDEDFGTAYTVLRQIGLPEAAAVSIAEQALELRNSGEEELSSFTDAVAEKLTTTLSYVAVFGIAFLLLSIIFAIVGNLIGFVFSLPGLKLVDVISGAVFGFFKGIIIVYSLAVIVRYFGILALSTLESTSLLNYLVNNNPIATLLGL
ncbi:MAG: CvpA family protein [Oscillospiraceae bacterium]|nr:CvpA family protein [Oscillospiraceae bacterium]